MLCMSDTNSLNKHLHTDTPEQTEKMAAAMALECPDAAVLYLIGELGAGKSTFARAFLRALGVEGAIKSPTYTLLEAYVLSNGQDAVHMDCYRMAQPDEVDYLALDTFDGRMKVLLVEWPEKAEGRLPSADIEIRLEMAEEGRQVALRAVTEKGRNWLNSGSF